MNDENQQPENDLGAPELPPFGEQAAPEWEHIAASGESEQTEKTAGLAEAFEFMATGICAYIASRKGAHWMLTPDEAKGFGVAADKVAALYIDGGPLSPWVGLALSVTMIAMPRMMQDAAVEKAKAKQAAADGQQQQEPN